MRKLLAKLIMWAAKDEIENIVADSLLAHVSIDHDMIDGAPLPDPVRDPIEVSAGDLVSVNGILGTVSTELDEHVLLRLYSGALVRADRNQIKKVGP